MIDDYEETGEDLPDWEDMPLDLPDPVGDYD